MSTLAPASHWILSEYRELEITLNHHRQSYALGHSVEALYRYLWDSFADWYVEYLKTDPSQTVFAKELYGQFLLTLHPYLPFETEALWSQFQPSETLLTNVKKDAAWSAKFKLDSQKVAEFKQVQQVINRLRSLRGLFGLDPATKLEVTTNFETLINYTDYFALLGKATLEKGAKHPYVVNFKEGVWFSLDILSYVSDLEEERERTRKKIGEFEKQIRALQGRLANPKFSQNAAPEIITRTENNLTDLESKIVLQRQKLTLLQSA